MTRAECETKMLGLLKMIADVCEEFHPGMSVCMSTSKNGKHYSVFSLDDSGKEIIYATHFEDGDIRIDGKYYTPDGRVY